MCQTFRSELPRVTGTGKGQGHGQGRRLAASISIFLTRLIAPTNVQQWHTNTLSSQCFLMLQRTQVQFGSSPVRRHRTVPKSRLFVMCELQNVRLCNLQLLGMCCSRVLEDNLPPVSIYRHRGAAHAIWNRFFFRSGADARCFLLRHWPPVCLEQNIRTLVVSLYSSLLSTVVWFHHPLNLYS